MNVATYLRRAIALPPHVVAQKAAVLARQELRGLFERQRDALRSTYLERRVVPVGPLYRCVQQVPREELRSYREEIFALAGLSLDHRFDLLGSGWVRVQHGMRCRGVEGHRYKAGPPVDAQPEGSWLHSRINAANLAASKQIWRLVDAGYTPIDWHLDFKSGYRWSEASWYRDVPYGHVLGADVKVPWELARMQHLPTLAWAHALAQDGEPDYERPEVYAREFRNQVLDFIATNPPRYGVNWRTTMDVAIRAANWLLAYDLFRADGASFDGDFEAELRRSVYAHGQHIVANLEWYPTLRGNHYLSDVVGLLVVAAFLPRTSLTDVWLAFAVQELVHEVSYQFGPDGANFEASTSYHRLAAEMVVFGAAVALGLPVDKRAALREYDHTLHRTLPPLRPAPLPLHVAPGSDRLQPFPSWYVERLEKMAEFTCHVAKPNGRIPQFGDNDSGRFLKLQPAIARIMVAEARQRLVNLAGYSDLSDDAPYWLADDLDHRHLVGAINGLFDRKDFASFASSARIDSAVVRLLSGDFRLPSYVQHEGRPAAETARVGRDEEWQRLVALSEALPEGRRQVYAFDVPGGDAPDELRLLAYPNFGLYLLRTSRCYLAVRCGPIGQAGNGGHAHNDQLAIELSIDGHELIVDPGTYLYTPLPDVRNAYRSAAAHFAPRAEGREPGRLDLGLFRLGDEAQAECLYFGPSGFVGRHRGFGPPVYRLIALVERGLRITDFAAEGLALERLFPRESSWTRPWRMLPLSPAYGVVER